MSRVFTAAGTDYLQAAFSNTNTPTEYTIAIWVKQSAADRDGVNQSIVTPDFGAGVSNPAIRYDSTENYRFDDQGGLFATLGAVDEWHLLVMRYSNVDGVSCRRDLEGWATNAGGTTTEFSNDKTLWRLGINALEASPFKGKLAHFAMWARRLNDIECDDLANGANPFSIAANGRIAYYPLIDDALDNVWGSLTGYHSDVLEVTGTVSVDTNDNPLVESLPLFPRRVQFIEYAESNYTPLIRSFNNPVTPGNTVVIRGSFHPEQEAEATITITDNQGNTYTIVESPTSDNQTYGGRAFIAYCVNVAASGTFTITGGPNPRVISFEAEEWNGIIEVDTGAVPVSIQGPLEDPPNSYGTSVSLTTSTPDATIAMIQTAFAHGLGTSNVRPPSGFIAGREASTNSRYYAGAYKIGLVAGAQTITWECDEASLYQNPVAVAVTFKCVSPIKNQAYVEGAWSPSPMTIPLPFTHTAGNGLLLIVGTSTGRSDQNITGATSLGLVDGRELMYIANPPTSITSLELTWSDGGNAGGLISVVEVDGSIDVSKLYLETATAAEVWGTNKSINVNLENPNNIILGFLQGSYAGQPLIEDVTQIGGIIDLRPNGSPFVPSRFVGTQLNNSIGNHRVGYAWTTNEGGGLGAAIFTWIRYDTPYATSPQKVYNWQGANNDSLPSEFESINGEELPVLDGLGNIKRPFGTAFNARLSTSTSDYVSAIFKPNAGTISQKRLTLRSKSDRVGYICRPIDSTTMNFRKDGDGFSDVGLGTLTIPTVTDWSTSDNKVEFWLDQIGTDIHFKCRVNGEECTGTLTDSSNIYDTGNPGFSVAWISEEDGKLGTFSDNPGQISVWTNFENGTLVSSNYTHATDEIPQGLVYNVDDATLDTPGGLWGDTRVLNLGTSWYTNGIVSYPSGNMSDLFGFEGRLLLEFEVDQFENAGPLFEIRATSESNGRIRAFANTSTSKLLVQTQSNVWGNETIVEFNYPVGPHYLEVWWNLLATSPSQQMAARLWPKGIIPSSFPALSNFSGTMGTADIPLNFEIGSSDDWNRFKYGKIIISKNRAEPLYQYIYDETVEYIPQINSISTSAIYQGQAGVIITGLNFGT